MVSDVTKKTILQIKENIDTYHNLVSDIDKVVAEIKEKYRKLAEEEVKEVRSHTKEYREEEKFWTKTLSRYDVDVVKEVLGESSDIAADTTPVKPDADVVSPVSDELFVTDPEENEAPAGDMENSEQSDITDEANMSEQAEAPTVEDAPAEEAPEEFSNDEWPDDNNDAVEVTEEATPAADIAGEDWPEQPQEW